MLKSQIMAASMIAFGLGLSAGEVFPDGSAVPEWFRQTRIVDVSELGKQYRITDYGIESNSTAIQTEKIQAVIDRAGREGGGVIVIPQGTFFSASLFFKPKTHLHLEEGAVLKGSDDISDFPLVTTRIEGFVRKYFPALVNADRVDGFTISGKGTIDGNGLRYWKAFWLRREFNPQCTNLDEMRPRLVFISNSKDVQLSGVKLVNSPFWTTHFYKCERVKLLNLHISSPSAPVKAPSTDAVDIDNCSDFLIKNCYLSVNDDAVALKGGRGPFADKDESNGSNTNIIIEDNAFGFCHSALTCGSESIHNRNVIFRNNTMDKARRVLQLKMRPDTPQRYEYIRIENITGEAGFVIDINPWMQFFDLKGEKDIRMSYADHITIANVKLKCNRAFNIKASDQYKLSNLTFENFDVQEENDSSLPLEMIANPVLKNIRINGENRF